VRWLVDTSAWSRRLLPHVAQQLQGILAEEEDSELVLSPSVLLELMRGPQHEAVAEERRTLTRAMEVLGVDDRTFELAAEAMERLALHQAEAHRLQIPDLITAALAHQHGCGVVHIDEDLKLLEAHGGLTFEARKLELPPPDDNKDGASSWPPGELI
jgi:predicted nucleic acid-binding protein